MIIVLQGLQAGYARMYLTEKGTWYLVKISRVQQTKGIVRRDGGKMPVN